MTGARAFLARHRWVLLVVAATTAAVAVVALVAGPGPRSTAPLDPHNPGPGGARAVARVLEDRGVATRVARSAGQLESAPVDRTTTVVVTRPDALSATTGARLADHASAGRLVLVDPGPQAAAYLGLGLDARPVSLDGPREAGCADPRMAGLSLEVDRATAYARRGCFAGEGGALLVREGRTDVLGAASLLRNDQVLRADNAAVALRLLGREPEVVWYVPDPADLTGEEGVTVGALLPDWLVPGSWLAGAVVVSVMLWRGRRLGPLVREPLPVEVTAIESTVSLGRLYRRAGDRGHVAEVLRRAARQRARDRLRVPPADDERLVALLAARTGRPEAEVRRLVGADQPAPAGDHDLIVLAALLAELDREADPAWPR